MANPKPSRLSIGWLIVTYDLRDAGRFSFQRRPTPVPGDLRISWRVALILTMLGCSRSNRASLAKLHILNDAVRPEHHIRSSDAAYDVEEDVYRDFRVEPAFARAIDFVVGERFAIWTKASGRAALQLTAAGIAAARSVSALDDTLVIERTIILKLARSTTENAIAGLLGERRRR